MKWFGEISSDRLQGERFDRVRIPHHSMLRNDHVTGKIRSSIKIITHRFMFIRTICYYEILICQVLASSAKISLVVSDTNTAQVSVNREYQEHR